MTHRMNGLLEAGCPECGHRHLVPKDATGVPIACERCDTVFQLHKQRVSRRPPPRSEYLAAVHGGSVAGPAGRSMLGASFAVLGIAVVVALLALLYGNREELRKGVELFRDGGAPVDSPAKRDPTTR